VCGQPAAAALPLLPPLLLLRLLLMLLYIANFLINKKAVLSQR